MKTESTSSSFLLWIKSDVSRSILLLTGVILIVIIGVSLTSWWSYSFEELQEREFITENNIYSVNTSGFILNGLDAVKVALYHSENRKITRITVRPRETAILVNGRVLERDSWEVHLWNKPRNSQKSSVTWAFIDPYSGQLLSMKTEFLIAKG